MPFRPFSLMPIVGAMLLGGCALAPVDRTPPPTPVSPAQFEAGIDRLEAQLVGQCGLTQDMLAERAGQDRRMSADIREVGGLLRGLRGDVARLDQGDSETQTVVSECSAEAAGLGNKELVGRSEWVGLPDVGTYLKARIDSGANTSSLSATEVTTFERDGEDWVRFKLGLSDDDVVVESVRDEWIEAPVEREVRVVQSSGEESRPVVSLLMTLGPLREPVEFTLSDRTHLSYPILLGRRFLMDIAVIDVAEHYVHPRPEFSGGESAEEADDDEASDLDDQEQP
ncbi:ATP-dependent zinc protease family protein [Halomonas sp. V046]|uniref:ATP-dependent zinc protease family protein n=1 Tax=Halomonas sp. V046 TaxID=3459611 RepID=UPI0040449C14